MVRVIYNSFLGFTEAEIECLDKDISVPGGKLLNIDEYRAILTKNGMVIDDFQNTTDKVNSLNPNSNTSFPNLVGKIRLGKI